MAGIAEERKVGYVRMDEGTVEDYALADELARPFMAATPQRLLAFMESLRHTFPGGRIDRYAHSLQTATRAEDAGECEEIVVAGLLHDVGDALAPHNHAAVGAEILRPYVSRHTFWMLRHHEIFQGYYFWDKIGKNRNEIRLAAEFPAPRDPAQAGQPFTHFRHTPPIRHAGEAYRVADPRHYVDRCPDLDLSGNTIYLTNDPPPGHPGSTTWLDQSGEQTGDYKADRQSDQ